MDESMNSMYENKYINNLTYSIDPNLFYSLMIQYNPNSQYISHQYETNINLMWEFINKVYTPDTIRSKNWAIFE